MARWRAFDRLTSVPKQRFSDEVILFADADGAFKSVDEDGVVTSVGSDGGVDSLATRVIGPVSIDYADFNTDGQLLDLFDTTAGDVLINAWYDPATVVNWDDSGPTTILFAETPPGPTVHGNQNYDFPLDDIEPGGGRTISDAIQAVGSLVSDHYIGGAITVAQQQVFAGGKYTARNRDGANDGANGHIDLYFLVATPTSTAESRLLPNPTDEGDVLTVVDGSWGGAPGGGSQPQTFGRINGFPVRVVGLAIREAPNGDQPSLFAAGSSKLTAVNLATCEVGTPLDLDPDVGAWYMAISRNTNQSKLYVSLSSTGEVLPVTDLANDPPTAGSPIDTGSSAANYVAISPDNTKAYVCVNDPDGVVPIDVGTDTPGDLIPIDTAYGVSIAPDGATAYVGGNDGVTPIDVATDAPGDLIPLDATPVWGLAVSPSGDAIYACTNGDAILTRITLPDLTVTTVALTSDPVAVAFHPSGRLALVTLEDATVAVIDVATFSVVQSLIVGGGPYGVIFDTAGIAYVGVSDLLAVSMLALQAA